MSQTKSNNSCTEPYVRSKSRFVAKQAVQANNVSKLIKGTPAHFAGLKEFLIKKISEICFVNILMRDYFFVRSDRIVLCKTCE